MEFLDPEQRICDEEILDFQPAVIKNVSSPVRVFPATAVRVLVNSFSIKVS